MSIQSASDPEELREVLAAYLPMDRRQALARGDKLPDRAFGAVLFADISGFTPMAHILEERLGPQRGPELLTRQLNRLYSRLVAAVHRYGGSVINFGGDAINCWFDRQNAPDGDIRTCLRRAVTCAFTMQEEVGRFDPKLPMTDLLLPVKIKVTLTAGDVRRFQVGDPRYRLIDTLAGQTMERLDIVAQAAQHDEVVVGEEIVAQLAGQVMVSQWRQKGEQRFAVLTAITAPAEPAPWPYMPPPPVEVTSQWILNPVCERLSRGEGEFLSELRLAAALFMHFAPLDYDHDEQAQEKLDAYIRWVQAVIEKHHGYFMSLTIGDKGSYILVSFGAPAAYGDEGARAVLAALELRTPPPNLAYIADNGIGISLGMVRTGAYGGIERREYSIHGTILNIAARLMSAAQSGQILATSAVAKAAGEAATFADLGPHAYKGLEQPLTTFTVVDYREPEGFPEQKESLAYVGRDAERARLTAQLEALQQGTSSNALIVGEAGIGKSRLMEELVQEANGLGLETIVGQGNVLEQNAAFHAWRPILMTLLGLRETDDAAAMTAAVSSHLAGMPEQLLRMPLLNGILPLNAPENKFTASMSGEVRANNTYTLLLQLLRQGKQPGDPLVVVLDDGQWLDSASWGLADWIRREMEHLLLVVLMRPVFDGDSPGAAEPDLGVIQPDEYTALLEAPETQRYELGPLTTENIAQLVAQKLGVKQVPEPILALINTRAEGHPFFSEEIALAMRDEGLIQVIDSQAILAEGAEIAELEFPDTVQGIITSRIDRLEPGQELALKVASVIGRVFLFRTLQEIHPVEADRPQLAAHLKVLARLDITPVEALSPELSYIFKHAITRDVAYSLLLHRQRQELHAAVAAWYEQNYPGELAPLYPLLVYHWREALNPGKTVYYLDKAGRQALSSYANREAVSFFTEALAITGEHPDLLQSVYGSEALLIQAQWLRQLGEAYLGLGQLPESRESLMRMLQLVKRPAPSSQVRLAATLFQHMVIQMLHRLGPGRLLNRATGIESEIFLETAHAYQQLAEIYYFANERLLTLNAGLHVLNLSERAKESPIRARAYANMTVICGLLSLHSAAEAYGRRALKTGEEVGDRSALAWANLLVGTYEIGLAHWAYGTELAQRSTDICRELGDLRQLGLSIGLLALPALYRADFDQSCSLYVEWHETALQAGNIQHQAFGLFGQAECLLPQGGAAVAVDLVEQGLRLIVERAQPTVDNRTAAIRGYGLLALARQRIGNDELAAQAAANGLEVLNQLSLPTRVTLLEGLSGVTETYLALWEKDGGQQGGPSEWRELARQACDILGRYGGVFDIGRPRAKLWWGQYYWLAGEADKARRRWQESLADAVSLSMPLEAAVARLHLGQHLEGEEGQALLTEAMAQFEEAGATYDVNLANSLLEEYLPLEANTG
ncbi:MAG: AAA family ATPase [Candidatus Promineifilaceae bacterium]